MQQTNEFYPYGDLFSTAGTASSNDNRYRFTGKELGDETGLYDFSARFLHTSLGRFTTIDPLAEKYPNISPYAYCNGNPVRYIDPNGMDIYVFDNGTYSHVIKEDDEHRIANITYDSKGNAKTSYYKFADPINDPSGIDSGELSQLQFVDQQTIIEMLNNQDAFNYPDIGLKQFAKMSNSTNTEYSNSFDYAAIELASRYKADVEPDNLITSPYLFISEGDTMAHNIMNYGIYLWGATGYTCGIKILVLAMGAHANSLGLSDLNNRKYNGYTPQFDSRDDQRSIYAGYKYARKYNFRTLLK